MVLSEVQHVLYWARLPLQLCVQRGVGGATFMHPDEQCLEGYFPCIGVILPPALPPFLGWGVFYTLERSPRSIYRRLR